MIITSRVFISVVDKHKRRFDLTLGKQIKTTIKLNLMPQLNKHSVNSSCSFTQNTPAIRIYLESKGFKGLSFFQGREFVYAFLTTRANAFKTWKEKDYSTFNEEDMISMHFLNTEISTQDEFKKYVDSLV